MKVASVTPYDNDKSGRLKIRLLIGGTVTNPSVRNIRNTDLQYAVEEIFTPVIMD